MPISSNRRQRVIEFATPKVADLVIVERVDASKNVNAATTAYESDYGTPHPDTSRFSGFKLALVKNSDDDQGQYQDWYYVADRTEQDKYNWEFQAAGGESPRFNTVVRTYVLPRYGSGTDGALGGGQTAGTHVFDELEPKINTVMPTSVHDPFGDGLGGNDPDAAYVLFEKKQVRSGDDFLDTLYVVEQRVYVEKVSIRRVDADEAFAYNDADITSSPEGNGLITKETLYYKDEDVFATIKFVDKDSGTDGIQEATSPSANATKCPMNASGEAKQAEYVFTNADATFQASGGTNTFNAGSSTQNYNFWGVDDYGILREGKQLSDNWYALVERQVIKPPRGVTNQISKYLTYQNYSWPAVLEGGDDNIQGDVDSENGIDGYTWTRKTGGGDTVIFARYKRHAYSGPTRIEVTLFWRKTKFAVSTDVDGSDGGNTELTNVVTMQPIPVNFVSPLESLNIGPTLHDQLSVFITTGTEHPVWELAGAQFSYEPTNFIDWPESIIISDTQKPFRGGWLRERIKAFRPNLGPADGSVQTAPSTS